MWGEKIIKGKRLHDLREKKHEGMIAAKTKMGNGISNERRRIKNRRKGARIEDFVFELIAGEGSQGTQPPTIRNITKQHEFRKMHTQFNANRHKQLSRLMKIS